MSDDDDRLDDAELEQVADAILAGSLEVRREASPWTHDHEQLAADLAAGGLAVAGVPCVDVVTTAVLDADGMPAGVERRESAAFTAAP